MDDDTKARNRLLAYTAVRRAAWRSSSSAWRSSTPTAPEGGWPRVGAIVAIMGALDAFFAPRLLKRAWDEQDRQGP